MPSTGELALNFLCGGWGASQCTPQRMFDFMGTDYTQGGYAPFRINYIAENSTDPVDNIIPKDPKIYKCSEKINVSFFIFKKRIYLLHR